MRALRCSLHNFKGDVPWTHPLLSLLWGGGATPSPQVTLGRSPKSSSPLKTKHAPLRPPVEILRYGPAYIQYTLDGRACVIHAYHDISNFIPEK